MHSNMTYNVASAQGLKAIRGETEAAKLKLSDFSNYIEGLEQIIINELEAYEFYRDIYLDNNNPIVRDVFFEVLADES
jgi:hypothetical protein